MTKFRMFPLLLTCILAIGLASCAPAASPDIVPQEIDADTPVPAQADLATPQPVQISIIGLLDDAPPDSMQGTLASHKLPKDAQTVTADAYPTLSSSLRAYGVVPLVDGTVFAYEGSNMSYVPAPSTMMNGEVAMTLAGVDENGVARYTGQDANGLTYTQWMVTRVACQEGQVCVGGVSMNEGDGSVVYGVAIDEATGQPVGRMPLVYNERPSVTDYGVSVGGRAMEMQPIGSDWVRTVTGETALWQMEPYVVSYERADTVDANVMTFQVGDKLFSAVESEIFYHPEVGGYVVSEEGVFVYSSEMSEWVRPDIQTQTDGAEILGVGGKNMVRVGDQLMEVEGVDNQKGVSV